MGTRSMRIQSVRYENRSHSETSSHQVVSVIELTVGLCGVIHKGNQHDEYTVPSTGNLHLLHVSGRGPSMQA
jgi:hypothetical protein